MGSFLFSPPSLFENNHGAVSVESYTVQMLRDQVTAGCEHLTRRGECLIHPDPAGVTLHQPHTSVAAGRKPACGKGATATKKKEEYPHVQPACGFGGCPAEFLPKSSTQLCFSILLTPSPALPFPSLSCPRQFIRKGS